MSYALAHIADFKDPHKVLPSQAGHAGAGLVTDGSAVSWSTGPAGTVTGVSVVSANGFAGSVANPGTTPAITLTTSITGLLKGNGTAISASVVTDDVQTKAAIVPNTAPGSGQMLVGNAGGTAYAPVTASGAVTLASTGAFTLATPGTLTVATANSNATAHTHAITTSNAPGAAASIVATDASGIIGTTGTRIVKIWATDLTVSNAIAGSVTGNAATVTTNANLTGPITSSGNATAIASQTGTGTKFVVDTSPTIATPTVTGTATFQGLIDASAAGAGQVSFPATQNASAGANVLDDYEEGSWTPVLTFVTPGSLNVVYSSQTGTYTKVGRKVTCWCQIATSTFTLGTATGSLEITGLPFTSANNIPRVGTVSWQGITRASTTQIVPRVGANAALLTFDACNSGSAVASVASTDTPTGGSVILRVEISYEI